VGDIAGAMGIGPDHEEPPAEGPVAAEDFHIGGHSRTPVENVVRVEFNRHAAGDAPAQDPLDGAPVPVIAIPGRQVG